MPVLLLPLSYVFIPASGFQLTVLPVTFSVLISKLIHCFSCCPAQSVMHSSCGYTDMMRETLAGESPCWVRNRQARQTLRVRDTQENRAYMGNFVKRKGRTGGERPSSGTRTEEEKRKIQREKGRRGRNRQSFACKGTGYACLAYRSTPQGPQGAGPGVPGC